MGFIGIVPVGERAREQRGKPKENEEPVRKGYRVDLVLERNVEAVDSLLNRKGRFILATNDLDGTVYPDALMLSDYKDQRKGLRH